MDLLYIHHLSQTPYSIPKISLNLYERTRRYIVYKMNLLSFEISLVDHEQIKSMKPKLEGLPTTKLLTNRLENEHIDKSAY